MEKSRLSFIDYGKALGILFVLMIHAGMSSLNEYVLFAMPLFYIASGYTLNFQKRDLKQYAKTRFLKLMIPFWTFSALDILLGTARAYFYRYGTYKIAIPALINIAYGSGFKVPDIFGIRELIVTNIPYVQPSERFMDVILPTNCHLWFLPAMFTASILAFIILKNFKDRKIVLIGLSFVLILVAALESLPDVAQIPYCIGRGCIGAVFIIVGYFLKEQKFFEKRKMPLKITAFAVTSVIALVFIKVLGIHGEGMVRSQYGSFGIWGAYLTFVGGTAAAIAVLSFFNILEQVNIGAIGTILSSIGQNTMDIYLWQFFGFFVLEIIYFTISGESAFPDKYWMTVLPPSGTWYKLVETTLVITATVLIKKRMSIGAIKKNKK